MNDPKRHARSTIDELCNVLKQVEALVRTAAPDNRELGELVAGVRRVIADSSATSPDEVLMHLRSVFTGGEVKRLPKDERDFTKASLAEVQGILLMPEATKTTLLRVAETRFGAPRGVLSRLNRADLISRLQSLIDDERSHDAIARLASSTKGEKLKS